MDSSSKVKIKKTLFGRSFWACAYGEGTVGFDEYQIKKKLKSRNSLQEERTRTIRT